MEQTPAQEYQEKDLHLTTMPGNLPDWEAFYEVSHSLARWEYHCHDFYEIYLHIGGGHYFGVDNELYALEPDQLFIIQPFCIHGLSSIGEMQDYERAYLNLRPDTLKKLGCGFIDLDRFFRSYTSHGKTRFQLKREEAAACVELIKRIQHHQDTTVPLERFNNCTLVLDFLKIICGIIDHSEALTDSVISNSIMQEVLTYINSNFTHPIRIDDLAHDFRVSTSYLSHEFSRYTHRSVYDYILYRRVMLAKEMISSDMTLNMIAYQCGFNDYSNFLRMFTRIVGESPAKYRKRIRQYQTAGEYHPVRAFDRMDELNPK